MKTSQLAALPAALIVVGTFVPTRTIAATQPAQTPATPTGVMSAFPTAVQTGTKPTLTWNILYPSSFNGPNPPGFINPPGTVIPTDTLYATVQIVGTGVSACDSTQDSTQQFSEVRVSFNGGAYQQLFYGTQTDVNPSKQLYIKKMTANQTLNFGGRYVKNGAWSPFYTSRSGNLQIVSLVNGQSIPTTFPLYQSPKLATYLRPYLDAAGKVKIGPLSVLVLMELGQTNRSSSCFDLQDQVLLVSFSTKHPNNGHGNNLDGVDSSNPGNGKGGPNGQIDPSGGVDDESK